jgi:cytochrome P450 PksS
LRAESPVHRVNLPGKQQAWLITRYDDVVRALKDERLAKDKLNALTANEAAKQPWVPRAFMPLTRNMLDLDAPDHTRLRALVHKAFTPGLVEGIRSRVQTLTDELLGAAKLNGRMDLINDYALPLPTTIIAQMLGVPAKDRNKFHRWSSSIVSMNLSQWAMLRAIPNVLAFMHYIRRLVKQRRTTPEDDLLSALVAAEESGNQLSEDELVAMIFLLLVAGHETTVNLIGNGTLALLDHPDQMAILRENPSLIKIGVEELLRFDSPLETATERYAREDIVIADTTIPRGALVLAVLASANRDEQQFRNADTLDVTRLDNKHLSFGQGIHYCLGASLARIEGQIAIGSLLRLSPDIKLAVSRDALRWRSGLVLRGLKALPLSIQLPRGAA